MKFLEKVAEKEDLKLYLNRQCDNSYCIEFEYYSNLEEDVIITLVVDKLRKDDIINAMSIYKDNFNAEEHATMWYNNIGRVRNVPTSLRDLLQDADEQQEKLDKIYNTMLKLK